MKQKLSIAIVVIAAVALWAGLSSNKEQTPQLIAPAGDAAVASPQQMTAEVNNEVVIDPQPTKVVSNKPIEPPNFDIRKVAKPVKKELVSEYSQYSDEQLNTLIAAKEAQLQAAIADHNNVLNDPQAKRKLQSEFKKQSEAYKKALLERVKRGEL